MIALYLATCLTGLVSAFVPVTPIEPYLVGVVATTEAAPLLLGVCAAIGQTAGKLVFFLVARGAIRSDRVRQKFGALARRLTAKKIEKAAVAAGDGEAPAAPQADEPRPGRVRGFFKPIGDAGKRLLALLDRPALTIPILFLSASLGMPPLLAASVYAASTRISAVGFTIVCLLGRSVRFVAIAYAPHLIMS